MEPTQPLKTRAGCLVKSQFPRCNLDKDEKEADHLVLVEMSPELAELINPGNRLDKLGAQAYLKIILSYNMPGTYFDIAIGDNVTGINMDARAFEPYTAQQDGPAGEDFTKFFTRVLTAIRAARAEYAHTHAV